MICIFAHKILSRVGTDAISSPENIAQPPTAIIISAKKITPGVLHHRQLNMLKSNAMAAASNAISTSVVNCQVNAKSSVY